MQLPRSTRTVKAFALAFLGLLVVPVSASTTKAFTPGVWQGRGQVAGGFSGRGVSVRVTRGAFAFCLTVARNGTVSQSKSTWVLRQLTLTERISSSGHVVTASGTANGAGSLTGRASGVKLKGAESMIITITVDGHQITAPTSFNVSTTMPIYTSSPHTVTGDVALKGRTAQQHAGFSSTERALYLARPVTHCTL